MKILLDLAIVIYLLSIPLLMITGGFNITVFGIHITLSSLQTSIKPLIPLILARLLVTIKLQNFALVTVSILLGLIAMEIVLRIWDPPIARPSMIQIHRPSDVLDWELIPGASGVGTLGELFQINSAGFRDVEHPVTKEQGIQRIIAMGDSFTFGMGVDLEDSYPKQLEKLLQRDKIRCEIINRGVVGYQMWQYLVMLEEKVLPYQPDLVVLGLFMDDITKSVPPYKISPNWKGHNPFESELSDEIDYSSVWNALKNLHSLFNAKYRYLRGYKYLQGIERRKQELGPDNPTHEFHKIQYGKLKKHVYEEFEIAFGKFVDILKSNGIPVIVALIPDASQLHEEERQAVNRFIRRTAHSFDVPFVDITAVFEQEADPRPLYLFPLDAHTSAKGHRLIAEALAKQIRDLMLLSF